MASESGTPYTPGHNCHPLLPKHCLRDKLWRHPTTPPAHSQIPSSSGSSHLHTSWFPPLPLALTVQMALLIILLLTHSPDGPDSPGHAGTFSGLFSSSEPTGTGPTLVSSALGQWSCCLTLSP